MKRKNFPHRKAARREAALDWLARQPAPSEADHAEEIA